MHLHQVDVLRADPGEFPRFLGGPPGNVLFVDVAGAGPHAAADQGAAQHPGPRRDEAETPQTGRGAQHHRGGSVGDRAAVQQAQRFGDRARVEDFLDADRPLVLREGVVDRVGVVLHRDRRDLFARRTVIGHVAPGAEAMAGGHDVADRRVQIARVGPDATGDPVGHFLHAHDQHDIVQSGG